jgi:hypothetical protein
MLLHGYSLGMVRSMTPEELTALLGTSKRWVKTPSGGAAFKKQTQILEQIAEKLRDQIEKDKETLQKIRDCNR